AQSPPADRGRLPPATPASGCPRARRARRGPRSDRAAAAGSPARSPARAERNKRRPRSSGSPPAPRSRSVQPARRGQAAAWSGFLDVACEQIAAVAHGRDQRLRRWIGGLKLLAQPADGHVDGAVERIGAAPARPVEELVTREHASRPVDEAGEEVELGGGQGHARSIDSLDAARVEIDDETAEAAAAPFAGTRNSCLGAPQDGADARQELARVERLAQVVVGAELEPDDAVDIIV